MFLLFTAVFLAAAAGCDRDRGERRGMPAAKDWKPPAPVVSQLQPSGGGASDDRGDSEGAVEGRDPHAGLDMDGQANPHAGLGGGGVDNAAAGGGQADPHAGLDMGGGEPGDDDPAMAGIVAPDPDRPIDESKYLRGTIRAGKGLEAEVRSGEVLFLSARPVDPATGDVLGAPIAVAKLAVEKLPMPFELTERDEMAEGTRFEGDVIISARVDGDGEARTKKPGDVEGSVRARVPAQGLELVLDSAVK